MKVLNQEEETIGDTGCSPNETKREPHRCESAGTSAEACTKGKSADNVTQHEKKLPDSDINVASKDDKADPDSNSECKNEDRVSEQTNYEQKLGEPEESVTASLANLSISRRESTDSSVIDSDSSDQEGDLDSDGLDEVGSKGKLRERGPQRSTSRNHSGKPYGRSGKPHQTIMAPYHLQTDEESSSQSDTFSSPSSGSPSELPQDSSIALMQEIEMASDQFPVQPDVNEDLLNLIEESVMSTTEQSLSDLLPEDGLPNHGNDFSGRLPAAGPQLPTTGTLQPTATGAVGGKMEQSSSFGIQDLAVSMNDNMLLNGSLNEGSSSIPTVVYEALEREDKPADKKKRSKKTVSKTSNNVSQPDETTQSNLEFQDAYDIIQSDLDPGRRFNSSTQLHGGFGAGHSGPSSTCPVPRSPVVTSIASGVGVSQVSSPQPGNPMAVQSNGLATASLQAGPSGVGGYNQPWQQNASSGQALPMLSWPLLHPFRLMTAGSLGVGTPVVASPFHYVISIQPESLTCPVQPQPSAPRSVNRPILPRPSTP